MIVDIHTHFYPRDYLDRLSQRTEIPKVVRDADGDHFVIFADEETAAGATRPIGEQFVRLEKKLEFMDQHGIDRAVISIGNPWVDFLEGEEAVTWANRLNDEVEQACAVQNRFLGLGVVPFHSIDAACAVVSRIDALPHVRGIIMGTRRGGVIWTMKRWNRSGPLLSNASCRFSSTRTTRSGLIGWLTTAMRLCWHSALRSRRRPRSPA